MIPHSVSETRRLLLAEVLENPTSDMVRLVYADHCEEFGDEERAEFIRVQCELAKMPWPCPECHKGGKGITLDIVCYSCERQSVLGRRERELMTPNNVADWLSNSPVGYVDQPGWGSFILIKADKFGLSGQFRRGFVEEVHCPCEQWMRHGPAVVVCQPVVKVVLTDKRPGGPHQLGQFGRTEYWWEPGIRFELLHQVPFCFGKAAGWKSTFFGLLMFYQFPTCEEALTALSDACLKWAQKEAKDKGLWPGYPSTENA